MEFNEADEALFRFLRECLPSPGANDIVIMSQDFDIHDLLTHMDRVFPGGFIFVEGETPQIYRIMKNHHFSRMPFVWRSYEIYRKRLEVSA